MSNASQSCELWHFLYLDHLDLGIEPDLPWLWLETSLAGVRHEAGRHEAGRHEAGRHEAIKRSGDIGIDIDMLGPFAALRGIQ
jgi:hypothetical protein